MPQFFISDNSSFSRLPPFVFTGNLFGASNYQQDKNARRVALLQEDVQNNDQSQDNTREVFPG